jgi:hypothetical protein
VARLVISDDTVNLYSNISENPGFENSSYWNRLDYPLSCWSRVICVLNLEFVLSLVVGNKVKKKQVHEDLEFSLLYQPHQISEKFDSKLADVWSHSVTDFGRYLLWPKVDPGLIKPRNRDRLLVGLPVKCGHVDTLILAQMALFVYPDWGFFRAFP